jgi:DNA-binding CsgD family transcriptional regulator
MLSEFENRFGHSAIAMSRLTERERRIVGLVAAGSTPEHVAKHLFLSPRTLEWSQAKIDRKLRPHAPSAVDPGSRHQTHEEGNRS